MAYTILSSEHLTSWRSDGTQMFQANHTSGTSQGVDFNDPDPIRVARNGWTLEDTHISDSSTIIDSIDVDMVDINQDESSTEVYIVLDTNVLIRQLLVLKQALARIEAPGAEFNVALLVPGIVVSELDHLKNNPRGIGMESRRASDWLAGEIGNGRGRVKGQGYTQTMLPGGDWRLRNGVTNDELILDCCRYFSHVKRKDVLLCTNDNNLAFQASSNAGNLFMRDLSAVIRPIREQWDARQLLERAIPGFNKSSIASKHAARASMHHGHSRNKPINSNSTPSILPVRHYPPDAQDGVRMEIDMYGIELSESLHSAGDRRDLLHRQVCTQLTQHLRKLTGKAANMQQSRRWHESIYSPANARFRGEIPTESDWRRAWSLRECLKFVAKVLLLQSRSWTFGDSEASSLADFLGKPGERGARPGREWAKHDWSRALGVVRQLGEDFQIEELSESQVAEYEFAVMEIFAVD